MLPARGLTVPVLSQKSGPPLPISLPWLSRQPFGGYRSLGNFRYFGSFC
jgi:hypothetical protein